MTPKDSELDLLLERSRANAPLIEQQVRRASPAQREDMMRAMMAALAALSPDQRALANEAIRRELARKGVDAHVALGSAGATTSGWQVFGSVLSSIAQVGVTIYAMDHDRKMARREQQSARERLEAEEAMFAARMEEERARREAMAQREETGGPGLLPGGINQQTLLIGGGVLLAAIVLLKR